VDPYLEKLEEWVDRSRAKVRADVVHEKLSALGYTGSERTTRRAVAEVKAVYRAGRRRVHRPWVPYLHTRLGSVLGGRHSQSQSSCTAAQDETERNVGQERTFAQVDVFAARPYGETLSRSSSTAMVSPTPTWGCVPPAV
jgi:hypothetical protein